MLKFFEVVVGLAMFAIVAEAVIFYIMWGF